MGGAMVPTRDRDSPVSMTGTEVNPHAAITRITANKENDMRRQWKMLAIVASVAVAGLAVVAGASAATDSPSPQSTSDACALSNNPQALEEMQALRTEKQEAWQAWSEKYGTERGSAEAQAEKQQLREQYQSDMTALHEKYGVEVPEGAGPGSRSGAGNGTNMEGGPMNEVGANRLP